MLTFFKRSVPLYFAVLVAVFTGLAIFFINQLKENTETVYSVNGASSFTAIPAACNMTPKRLGGYNYIAPLLFIETQCEAESLEPLKNSIVAFIQQQKASGILNDASFYLRDISKTEWTGYNQDAQYFPGSLLKVPELISYLCWEEQKPGILNTKYFYDKPFFLDKNPVFLSKTLASGKAYTVKELLQYMITYSDNNATMVLNNNLDKTYFDKIIADFNMAPIDWTKPNYLISPKDFSVFMRVIYNASYLNINHSEWAAELLSTCNFKDGFAKGIPPGTKMIHKFGEAGDPNEKQLHESAIIYINDHAYLLTVMTKGYDTRKLATVLAGIANIVYKNFTTAP